MVEPRGISMMTTIPYRPRFSEQLWTVRVRVALTFLALLLSTAGCRYLGGNRGSGPVVGAAFASRAATVCEEVLADGATQHAYPERFDASRATPSELRDIAPFLTQRAVIFQDWLYAMNALGDPPSAQVAWALVLGAVASRARISAELAAAAKAGVVDEFLQSSREAIVNRRQLSAAADSVGVPECGAVDERDS
jgi:hypothetical protein